MDPRSPTVECMCPDLAPAPASITAFMRICPDAHSPVQGDITYGAITDNWPTLEPYFNETGSNCPSNLSRHVSTVLVLAPVRT